MARDEKRERTKEEWKIDKGSCLPVYHIFSLLLKNFVNLLAKQGKTSHYFLSYFSYTRKRLSHTILKNIVIK